MPVRLSTTVSKINSLPNLTNANLLTEFYQYMKNNGSSESHMNNSLKTNMAFATFIGSDTTFYDIQRKEQIVDFLDTKIKSKEEDPDRKCITTWNDYLNDIKYFFRWLYNTKIRKKGESDESSSDWETPTYASIKEKKTKRISPYLETELWELEELLLVIKYESFKRNKAALALFWDLDARNHEVTLLKIKHVRLKERYGEGEIPYQAKTGSGPILLTVSFPFVRDWLNEHPFRNEPDARLICNLLTGAPVKPEAMWTMMKQLKNRIIRMVEKGTITNDEEKQKLEYLLKSKKWNPYCLRHSAITSDSDFLPEYALKKKVRWSMNSKQGSRYIKKRMGSDLKRQILVHNGIISDSEMQKRPAVLTCSRCMLVNAIETKYCSKCSYPLVPAAFEEIKEEENRKIKGIEEKHQQDMKTMREEMYQQLNKIMSMIQKNSQLAYIKPEALTSKTIQQ
ncbi:MAG TPA: hypothetical protein VFS97_02555 [Nitrososphaeraceae archaeon]|nr:hypothetical protein [Nitrososphaeraceae archaeon]